MGSLPSSGEAGEEARWPKPSRKFFAALMLILGDTSVLDLGGRAAELGQMRKQIRTKSEVVGCCVDQCGVEDNGMASDPMEGFGTTESRKKADREESGYSGPFQQNLVVAPQAVEFKVQQMLTLNLNSSISQNAKLNEIQMPET